MGAVASAIKEALEEDVDDEYTLPDDGDFDQLISTSNLSGDESDDILEYMEFGGDNGLLRRDSDTTERLFEIVDTEPTADTDYGPGLLEPKYVYFVASKKGLANTASTYKPPEYTPETGLRLYDDSRVDKHVRREHFNEAFFEAHNYDKNALQVMHPDKLLVILDYKHFAGELDWNGALGYPTLHRALNTTTDIYTTFPLAMEMKSQLTVFPSQDEIAKGMQSSLQIRLAHQHN